MTTTVESINEKRVKGAGGTPGLLCWPKGTFSGACVMIIHERYGLVKHTEDLTRRLAGDGFVAMAPDLFWDYPDQEALHRGDVGVDPTDDQVLRGCEDVFPCYKEVSGADSSRFGMIGVCQSGRYPLLWAAHHKLEAAVVLYGAAQEREWEVTDKHPGLDTLLDGMLKSGSNNVLGIFGEADHVISIPDVLRFRGALEQRNFSYDISIIPKVPHGWLNDTMPGRYRPEEAKQTWDRVIAYLRERTKPGVSSPTIEWNFRSTKSSSYDFSKNVRFE